MTSISPNFRKMIFHKGNMSVGANKPPNTAEPQDPPSVMPQAVRERLEAIQQRGRGGGRRGTPPPGAANQLERRDAAPAGPLRRRVAAAAKAPRRPRPREELAGLAPIDKLLAQLEALGLNYQRTDYGYASRCPKHLGTKRNFEFTVADDGSLLVCCQAYHDAPGAAACTQEDVVKALGLTFADLFPGGGYGEAPQPVTRRQPVGDAVAKPPPTAEELTRWRAESEAYEAALTDEGRAQLAALLGVSACALRSLHVGWKAENRHQAGSEGPWVDDGPAWTFPEKDPSGRITGIMRRYQDPALEKRVIYRSRRGLYLPDGWREMPGPVFVPEGASDVAALGTAGRCAVGRPNVGGLDLLADLLRGDEREVVIAGENDRKPNGTWPGDPEPLAVALATRLGRPVKHLLPPPEFKDLRAYINHLSASESKHHVEA